GTRDTPLAEALVADAAYKLALVHDRHPDRELGRHAGARTLPDLLPRGLYRHHGRLGVGELAGEHRLPDGPAPHVLEHTGVHRQGVVPTLALEHLEVDHVVAEPAVQAAVQDLDQVGLGDAAPQLVDEGG